KQSFEKIKDVLYTTIKNLEKRYEKKQAVTGVPSGYHRIDAMTAGMQPGDLIIIAARPSMGKTSFVMNMVLNAAMQKQKDPDGRERHPFPALVFSLEMSKESLCERLLCSEARVDSMKLRGGFLETKDWIRITTAAGKLAEAPILIDDSGAPTLLEIRAKARRWRADSNLFYAGQEQMGVLVIDYLQLIQGRASKDDNRQREISEISRGLKALAKELRCPVIALSQLNRSLETRADKRPMMSDLRESGAIEQDADVIAFIYRDEVYSKDQCKEEDKGVAEIIIGKQRNGPTGVARLAFLNMYTRFENLAEGRDSGD
ncbi:MAG: replicative DNA helicase, partial [Polyangia bacterium]